jgi:hypothetical protein
VHAGRQICNLRAIANISLGGMQLSPPLQPSRGVVEFFGSVGNRDESSTFV